MTIEHLAQSPSLWKAMKTIRIEFKKSDALTQMMKTHHMSNYNLAIMAQLVLNGVSLLCQVMPQLKTIGQSLVKHKRLKPIHPQLISLRIISMTLIQ